MKKRSDLRQGSWHPENWDAVTLLWLKTDDGKATLALLKAAPELLATVRDLVKEIRLYHKTFDAYKFVASERLIAKAEGRSS